MKRILMQLVAFSALLVVVGQARADTIFYSQPADQVAAFASQNDAPPFGNFATVYDNFTLGSNIVITDVEWIGAYFNADPDNFGVHAITGFTLSFWSDISNSPDLSGPLLTAAVGGNASETDLGIVDSGGNEMFSYRVVLPTLFAATGGTTYWLSIVADLVYSPQWGWETGVGGDGLSYQRIDLTGVGGDVTLSPIPSDFAFSLSVPEPSSLLLLGLGLGGLALAGYRRKKA